MSSTEKEYRACVGIMLINGIGQVFVGKRITGDPQYWQMPQGGVDDGEDVKAAALRELLEEVGVSNVEIVAENSDWVYYDLPEEARRDLFNGRFYGQKQRWFLMKFLGDDKDINLNFTDLPEFKKWSWKCVHTLADNVVPFKKEVYQLVVEEFAPIIESAIKK